MQLSPLLKRSAEGEQPARGQHTHTHTQIIVFCLGISQPQHDKTAISDNRNSSISGMSHKRAELAMTVVSSLEGSL